MADASRLAGYVTDVTDEAAAGRLIDRILANHGPLDVLVQKISTRRHD
jgi:NAD(P)-dependent dehydrogenase (short-subunit alcohol dehydrogenase family)